MPPTARLLRFFLAAALAFAAVGARAADGPLALVADLEALRAHLGQDRVWRIGHSMAGVMATHDALAQPQRVQGLVLIGSLAAADKAYDADLQRRLARRKDQPSFPAALKALQENPSTQADFDRGMRE